MTGVSWNTLGLFNVTMIVTNQYGRSLADASLYRRSSSGELYNFEAYAGWSLLITYQEHNASVCGSFVGVSEISSSNGSVEGGTNIIISGEYFGQSERNPLVVTVGDVPCTILSSSLTTIECQTPMMPSSGQSHHAGELICE